MEIINKPICLTLNGAWQPVGQKTVKDAVCSIMDSDNYRGVSIDYELDSLGAPIFDKVINMEPLKWDEWTSLPIRDWDVTISSPSITIRVPTVMIATQFKHMPKLTKKMCSSTIWERDKGICQYTGKKLSRNTGNVDHVIPKSRGGKDTWSNLVVCDKELNTMKGSKLPHEAGLQLIRSPKEPRSELLCETIRTKHHYDWTHFII
tara:strand:+ start:1436 stop:2050 length:615 start_codon:yes stop_codon:yes gene_type:complete